MNQQGRFSQKKPDPKGKTIHTLPCESPQGDSINFDSLFPKDNSKKIVDPTQCSSPTFAASDSLSIRSVRWREKENLCINDWKMEAQIAKGHSQKVNEVNELLEKETMNLHN